MYADTLEPAIPGSISDVTKTRETMKFKNIKHTYADKISIHNEPQKQTTLVIKIGFEWCIIIQRVKYGY